MSDGDWSCHMRIDSRTLRSAVLGAVAVLGATAVAAPPERTLLMDPVELIAGREVPGKPELAIEHEGIEYRFATPENKAAFEKEPPRYEVFDGGACGRMGALSGLGDARRYAVHGGRIFFFASDGCRAGFLKDPAKHIETDHDKIFGSHEQVVQGRATLDKTVAWAGGAERLRSLTSYRASAARTEKQGDKQHSVSEATAIAFPDRYFQKNGWDESWYSTVSGPDGAAMATSSRGSERIAASRAQAFRRTMARWPVVILKAHVDGSAKADCPGLIVIADGEGHLADAPVEFVKVWLNGAAARLTIDKSSGRLLQLAFRGRDNTMTIGDCVRTYTAYASADGVTLPTAYTTTFDGKDLPRASAKVDTFEVNPKLPADQFRITQ